MLVRPGHAFGQRLDRRVAHLGGVLRRLAGFIGAQRVSALGLMQHASIAARRDDLRRRGAEIDAEDDRGLTHAPNLSAGHRGLTRPCRVGTDHSTGRDDAGAESVQFDLQIEGLVGEVSPGSFELYLVGAINQPMSSQLEL